MPTSVSEDADRRVFEEHAPNVAPFIEQSLKVPIFSNEAEARKMTLEYFVPPFLRTWLEPQWAIQKVIGVVPSSELEQLLGTKWWRDYTTDFILERFKPWSIYISFNDMADPTGSDRLYEGAYVTFDRQDGELRLVIQHMTRTGVCNPALYHSYPFPKGRSLVEIVENYAYDSPYAPLVESLDVEGDMREVLRHSGRVIACRVLPLLIAMLSEDFERVMLKIDMRTGEYDLHRTVELANRPWDGDIFSTLKRASSDEVSLLVVRQKEFGLDGLLNRVFLRADWGDSLEGTKARRRAEIPSRNFSLIPAAQSKINFDCITLLVFFKLRCALQDLRLCRLRVLFYTPSEVLSEGASPRQKKELETDSSLCLLHPGSQSLLAAFIAVTLMTTSTSPTRIHLSCSQEARRF